MISKIYYNQKAVVQVDHINRKEKRGEIRVHTWVYKRKVQYSSLKQTVPVFEFDEYFYMM